MARPVQKFVEKFMRVLLTLCGTVTSITVGLIIFFLFREGAAAFNQPVVEQGSLLLVSSQNTVQYLSAKTIKDIYDEKITDWAALGGKPGKITPFRLGDITEYYKEDQLGENYAKVPALLETVFQKEPGMVAFVPLSYGKGIKGTRQIETEKTDLASFLRDKEWFPTAEPAAQFGVLPLLLGTLWVSLGAILLALPLGLATAIYMDEVARPSIRNAMKPVVELLAGIPSVVYGFFGLVIVVPAIQKVFNLDTGETGLAGSIILAIMALPTIITISEDALRTVPRNLKEASLALGATRWQTVRKVVLPYAGSGITAATILGVGRAVGETMAVLMVTGNAAVIPKSYFAPLRTIPATIAAELGEAPYGGIHFKMLFALGCILFIITFFINLLFELVGRKRGGTSRSS